MADEKKNIDAGQASKPVANLQIPEIIAALHQNAIEKCKGDLGDKFRLTNSAIDDTGGKISLTSAGEHIISITPTEAAIQNDENVSKKEAIKALKTYVSWFVGPDLASKVNDSTVKSLNEAPGVANESAQPFMSFSQYLHLDEAKGDEEEETPDFGKKKDTGKDDEQPDFSKSKDDEDKKDDYNDNEAIGYYVSYELKVEGLKRTSIETAIKTSRGSLFKYLRNFFDDVTFTASSIFGGGGSSFTIKDVKDKLRATFGPIDPDELVKNVQERLDKKFKGSTPHAEVAVQDKNTLIQDLGKAIDGKQKQQIEKADYSLFIKVDQDDPKKPLLNQSVIADIVQASIKGMFKKFKNRVTKNDVIFIKNYKDTHDATDKIRSLYKMVPTPNQIQKEISSAKDVNDAISKIETKLDRIDKSPYLKDCARADKCIQIWKKFYKDTKSAKRSKELSHIQRGEKAFDDFFMPFIDAYNKAFDKTKDDSLNESISFYVSLGALKNDMLKMMFESTLLEGSNDEKRTSVKDVDAAQLSNAIAKSIKLNNIGGDIELNAGNVVCAPKDAIKKKLRDFKTAGFDEGFGDFKNAVLVCFHKSYLSESLASEDDVLKSDIMNILFEEDADKKDDKGKSNSSSKVDPDEVLQVVKNQLSKFGINDVAKSPLVLKLDLMKTSSEEGATTNDAFVIPFGSEDEIAQPVHSQANDVVDNSDSSGFGISRNDLYIIPMPGLKYEDPEFANKNLK